MYRPSDITLILNLASLYTLSWIQEDTSILLTKVYTWIQEDTSILLTKVYLDTGGYMYTTN